MTYRTYMSRRRVLTGALLAMGTTGYGAANVVIFAASSLKPVLDELITPAQASVSYGGSGALARQITHGAPADIFFSANPRWMNHLTPFLQPGTQRNILSNALVIVGTSKTNLAALSASTARIATGLTRSVPLGIYAKASLQHMGLWAEFSPRLVETNSAYGALSLVLRREVPFAIVYATDLRATDGLQIIATLPTLPNMPIVYPIALTRTAQTQAIPVYEHLQGAQAKRLYRDHGFKVL